MTTTTHLPVHDEPRHQSHTLVPRPEQPVRPGDSADLRATVPTLSVLLIDGDRDFTGLLSSWLTDDGNTPTVEHTAASAFSRALRYRVDALLVEVDLPDGDGTKLVRSLRRLGVSTPVLMHSATTDDDTVLRSFDAGADGFVPKPTSFPILAARMRALHRRSEHLGGNLLRVGDLVLDHDRLEAFRGDALVDLTPAQATVLDVLMHNVGRVVSRDQLSAHLPEGRPTRRSNVIDVHIRALRSKLDDPFDEPMIETIRGAGYRIRRPQPAPSPF